MSASDRASSAVRSFSSSACASRILNTSSHGAAARVAACASGAPRHARAPSAQCMEVNSCWWPPPTSPAGGGRSAARPRRRKASAQTRREKGRCACPTRKAPVARIRRRCEKGSPADAPVVVEAIGDDVNEVQRVFLVRRFRFRALQVLDARLQGLERAVHLRGGGRAPAARRPRRRPTTS